MQDGCCSVQYFRALFCWKLGLIYACALTIHVADPSHCSPGSVSITVAQQLFISTGIALHFFVTAAMMENCCEI